MNRSENVVYEALRQHVTGLFKLYPQFVPGKPFRVLTEEGPSLLCEVVDHHLGSGYSDEYAPVYIVFKCGTLYFKLDGYQDSYGGIEWDTFITEVERKEKVVYLYE